MTKKTAEHYAHYNDSYKKMLVLARALKAPEPREIFGLVEVFPSNSQLQGWRVGCNSKQFRIISENELLLFVEGLILWADSVDR